MRYLHTHVAFFLAKYQIICILTIATVTMVKARKEIKKKLFCYKSR